MRFRFLFLLATAVPLAAQTPAGRAKGASTIPEIPMDSLAIVGRAIKLLRVQPQTLTIRVGEKVDLAKLTVTVIDGSGRVRGRLSGFDFSIPPGEPASVVPRQITGDRPGTTYLVVRYPRLGWVGRTDPRPEAKVKVVVTK